MTGRVGDDIYYRHAGRVSLFNRMSLEARRRIFDLFMREIAPDEKTRILDVGVSLDLAKPEANVLEQLYPYPDNLVCAGIGEGKGLEDAYPGTRFVRITPGEGLPFETGEFDVVYSNAVLEHAGSRDRQRKFAAELCRVAGRVFAVVPNRLFPIEHHTGVPLLHYLPLSVYRALLSATGLRYWADERNFNPLLASELRNIFPGDRRVRTIYSGLGFAFLRSNLVAIR